MFGPDLLETLPALVRRRPAPWLAAFLAAAGLGCSEPHDPLTARCLEALAYRFPDHGAVREIDRGPSDDAWSVGIHHEAAESGQTGPLHHFRCEYEIGDRWKFRKIVADGRELRESELALVNAELFLRDLGRSPERFDPRRAVSSPPPEAATGMAKPDA